MATKAQDEFYIGYLPEAPEGLRPWLCRLILGLLGLSVGVAAILLISQQPFYPSVFEFGISRPFEGIVEEFPYPMLLVERPGMVHSQPQFSRYFLVAFGKYGAEALVKNLNRKKVRFRGQLIYRDGQTMIEILDDHLEPLEDGINLPVSFSSSVSLGDFILTGEIVDSKCFLGVMNPGNLKPHQACAIRCISGGIPPVLVVKDSQGRATYYLLVSETGKMVNQDVLDKIAVPVRIAGEVIRQGDILLLKADPNTYQRL